MSCLLLRGGSIRALGWQPVADGDRVGSCRFMGLFDAFSTGVSMGEPRRCDSRQHRSAAVRYRPGWDFHEERISERLLRNDRRRLGVDVKRFLRISRLSEFPLPRVFGRVLRHRVQGSARRIVGNSQQCDSQHVSQLGLSDSATNLQWFRLRARRMKNGIDSEVSGNTPPYTVHRSRQQMVSDVHQGLTHNPKQLSPKYFYDERGSELFEEITQLPEYYLTRAERSLLESRIPEIISNAQPCSLVELGAGSATKTRIILDQMRSKGCAECYVPVDVSKDFLEATAIQLRSDYADIQIMPVVSDITEPFSLPPLASPPLVAFLGSTIGNFPRQQAVSLLSDRKSTRLNSSHLVISYAVFCLKKKINHKVSSRIT